MIKFLKIRNAKILDSKLNMYPLITAFKDNYDARLRKSQNPEWRYCVEAMRPCDASLHPYQATKKIQRILFKGQHTATITLTQTTQLVLHTSPNETLVLKASHCDLS